MLGEISGGGANNHYPQQQRQNAVTLYYQHKNSVGEGQDKSLVNKDVTEPHSVCTESPSFHVSLREIIF